MNTFSLTTDQLPERIEELHFGDRLFLSGIIYTARDAAHRRLHIDLDRGTLPLQLRNSTIYYSGPCPGVIGKQITSAGPTTSGRMDVYTPRLLDLGVRATIGKGPRSQQVREAALRNKAVYLAATGGAGALLAQCITSYEPVCYTDLGPEAILALHIENMPLIVADDIYGNSIYR